MEHFRFLPTPRRGEGETSKTSRLDNHDFGKSSPEDAARASGLYFHAFAAADKFAIARLALVFSVFDNYPTA